MKTVSVWITNDDITWNEEDTQSFESNLTVKTWLTGVTDINSVGEVGYRFGTDSSNKVAIFVKDNNTMTLDERWTTTSINSHWSIINETDKPWNHKRNTHCWIWRCPTVLSCSPNSRTIWVNLPIHWYKTQSAKQSRRRQCFLQMTYRKSKQVSRSIRDTWTSERQTLLSDGQSSDDINVSNRDLLDEMSISGEDLHPTSFIAAITNDELAVHSNRSDFPRIPKLSFFLSWNTELIFELSGLVEYLYSMIVRVSHDDLLVSAQTETMWSIELTFLWSQRAEFCSNLHRLSRTAIRIALRDIRIVQLHRTVHIKMNWRERSGRSAVVAVSWSTAVCARVGWENVLANHVRHIFERKIEKPRTTVQSTRRRRTWWRWRRSLTQRWCRRLSSQNRKVCNKKTDRLDMSNRKVTSNERAAGWVVLFSWRISSMFRCKLGWIASLVICSAKIDSRARRFSTTGSIEWFEFRKNSSLFIADGDRPVELLSVPFDDDERTAWGRLDIPDVDEEEAESVPVVICDERKDLRWKSIFSSVLFVGSSVVDVFLTNFSTKKRNDCRRSSIELDSKRTGFDRSLSDVDRRNFWSKSSSFLWKNLSCTIFISSSEHLSRYRSNIRPNSSNDWESFWLISICSIKCISSWRWTSDSWDRRSA